MVRMTVRWFKFEQMVIEMSFLVNIFRRSIWSREIKTMCVLISDPLSRSRLYIGINVIIFLYLIIISLKYPLYLLGDVWKSANSVLWLFPSRFLFTLNQVGFYAFLFIYF
ncbi:hypothetical protein AQUCO_00201420v1 [Aquilegia coerulea]|uniref:Uncharacterized protein n=1 Tax=Aquilegia coerulea TaxID=218851 RepID=A0A2G5F806_AQUCA|nr:hypothetical protein AQUCO_00201420v1 [Aquilegia coerulea]